jgi:hypothetical protein
MAAVIIALRRKQNAEQDGRSSYRTSLRKPVDLLKNLSTFHTTGAGNSEGVGWRRYQKDALALYHHQYMQISVAGLIVANFITNIIQAQIDPKGNKLETEFGYFELFFNLIFLMELLLNMYSTWFRKFWKSSWNIFDFFVVLIGWLFQLGVPLPGPMKLLRMMRAFRVFRLFKRVQSLRKIMSSLVRAVPGVMNAFLIQLIIICIFAIIAVDRFRDWGETGKITNEKGVAMDYETSRGLKYGEEYYDYFGKALFTLFQVLTTESWAEAVARPLINSDQWDASTGAAFFFVFFSILNGIILVNVVIAVLLEKMVDQDGDAPAEGDDGQQGDGEDNTVFDLLGKVLENKMMKDLRAVNSTVDTIKQQMNTCNMDFAAMQKELSEVNTIKEQVGALLAHLGLKDESQASQVEAPRCLQTLQTASTIAPCSPYPVSDVDSPDPPTIETEPPDAMHTAANGTHPQEEEAPVGFESEMSHPFATQLSQ